MGYDTLCALCKKESKSLGGCANKECSNKKRFCGDCRRKNKGLCPECLKAEKLSMRASQARDNTSETVIPSSLDHLRNLTTIVADTGDFKLISQFQPQDATTNPSLVYQASQLEEYQGLVDGVIEEVKSMHRLSIDAKVEIALERLVVRFGVEILKLIKGRVSTEVDASLSFDTEATIRKARQIIALYEEAGISKERILIKIASTWEGIQAGKQLEQEGIHVNMTLLFGFYQAVVCAQANVTLISPFVGRIYDWYKNATGVDRYENPSDDPGVESVSRIFYYYKKYGHDTVIMGASFRNVQQIMALAGVDYLTISPALLTHLKELKDPVPHMLSAGKASKRCLDANVPVDEKKFRWELNQDQMATEKLSDGIRKFTADLNKLRELLRKKLEE